MAHLAAPRPDELTQPGTDAAPPSRWRPTVDGVAPTGLRTKVAANLRALETLRTIDNEARPATHDEQAILSRWSSWGALPAMFDSANEQWAELRSQLEQLLTPEQWSAARRTTLNAHYTQPGVIGPVWDFVRALGFDGGRVLEPGCGSGHFIGFAPTEVDIDWTGVELDPTTARIAQLLYPQADIRTEGFEQTALADGSVDLVVGNVPFGKIALHDPAPQSRRAFDPQPLHHQVVAPVSTRRARCRPHVAVHARLAQRSGPLDDRRTRRLRHRDSAPVVYAPGSGRHRRRHRPRGVPATNTRDDTESRRRLAEPRPRSTPPTDRFASTPGSPTIPISCSVRCASVASTAVTIFA